MQQFPTTGTQAGDIATGLIKNGVYDPNATIQNPTVPPAVTFPRYTGVSGSNPVTLTDNTQSKIDTYYNALPKNAPTADEEQAIRDSVRSRMQAVIDSVNAEYAPQIAQETNVNAPNRLGQTRAIQARSGTLGSEIATAQTNATVDVNNRVMGSIEAEKQAKIAQINGAIDAMSEDQIKAKKAEALGNADKYNQYLQSALQKAQDNVKMAAGSGVALDQLPTDYYNKLLDAYNGDEFLLKSAYNSGLPKEKQIDYKVEISNGKLFAYGFDPATGKFSQIVQDLPQGVADGGKYSYQTTPDGTVLLIPEKLDPNKPNNGIVMYGKEGQFKNTSSDTTADYKNWVAAGKPGTFEEFLNKGTTRDTKMLHNQIDQAFETVKGSDGFVSPDSWNKALQLWVSSGYGTQKQFVDAHANYTNKSQQGYLGF